MNVIRIHSVGEDWPALKDVPGIKSYWDRSLLRKGVVFVHSDKGDYEEYYQHLTARGLGADEVIPVPMRSGSFYKDIINNECARKELLDLVENYNYKLDLFDTSEASLSFVSEMGLQWTKHTVNSRPDKCSLWANKISLRKRLAQEGYDLCPEYEIVETEDRLYQCFDRIANSKADGVVVKRPDLASTEGQKFYPSTAEPDDFLEQHWSEEAGAIVEEAWEHWPCSVMYEIESSSPEFLYISLQSMGNSQIDCKITSRDLFRGDLAHMGNAVGSCASNSLGPLGEEEISSLRSSAEKAASLLYKSGFRGKACFDFAFTKEGPKLLECNPRNSHSIYMWSMQQQLENIFGSPIVVIGCNVENVREEIQSFKDANRVIPNPTSTVLFHTPLLHRGITKCGVIGVGRTFGEANQEFKKAKEALQK